MRASKINFMEALKAFELVILTKSTNFAITLLQLYGIV